MGLLIGLGLGLGILLILSGLHGSRSSEAEQPESTPKVTRPPRPARLSARARRERAEAWPDAVDHIASGVRAGLSLPESLMAVAERGPESLRPAFAAFGRHYESSGRFGDSLDVLKVELADPTGDRVIESLRLAREVGGGDLGRLLRSVSSFLRDDLRLRGEVEARQSWTVAAARLAAAAPWIVLALVSFQPGALEQYASPTGIVIIVVGAVVSFGSYRAMVRLGRLPDERRVFA